MSAFDIKSDFLLIAGPTASGKSSLALDIAKKANGTIINADSMQVYRDLPVLTACPSEDDKAVVPHRLYQCLDGATRCSVALWLKLVREAVAESRSAGRLPILVGGTGMYLQAALHGISPIPDVSDAIQSQTQAELEEMGGALLKATLSKVDPILGEKLEAGDSQRLVRALSVYRQTGRSLSSWQTLPGEGQVAGKAICLALLPERQIVYDNIDNRFEQMLVNGGLEEVKALLTRHLAPSLPVMKALGVSALQDYLAGNHDLERAMYLAKRDSRHYAKRQMTWLRNNYIPQITIAEKYSKRNIDKIFSEILKFT